MHSCNDDYLHRGPISIIGWYKFNEVAIHSFKSMGFCSCHLQETESVLLGRTRIELHGIELSVIELSRNEAAVDRVSSSPIYAVEKRIHKVAHFTALKAIITIEELLSPSSKIFYFADHLVVANVLEHVQLQDPSIILHDYWSSCWHGVQLLATTTNCLSHSSQRASRNYY